MRIRRLAGGTEPSPLAGHGRRSPLAEFLLPDCKGLVDSALDAGGASWHSAASGGAWGVGASSLAASSSGGATQFFEAADAAAAGSALTTLRSGFSGLVSSTAATLQGIAAAGPDGSAAPPPPALSWQLHVSTANLSVLLFYPDAVLQRGLDYPPGDGAGAYAGAAALLPNCVHVSAEGIFTQSPHVSVECTDLEVRASGGGATGRASCGVRVYRLEAAEHLPGSPEAVTELAEAASVPDALPPLPGLARPQPSFFGAVPAALPAAASPAVAANTAPPSGKSAFTLPPPGLLPGMRRSSMGGGQRSLYSSTLSELSFMSASGMLGSSQQHVLAESAASLHAGPATAAEHTAVMLVRPVLCCGGGGRLEGGSPSLHVAVQLPASNGSQSVGADRAAALSAAGAGDPDAHHRVLADVTLKPVTLWVSLPLLQRLEAYAASVFPPAVAAAAPAASEAANGERRSGVVLDAAVPQQQAAKSAAQRAIDSILLDMQVWRPHAHCPDLVL